MKENGLGSIISGLKVGFLPDFGETRGRDGITRNTNDCRVSEPPCLCVSVREEILDQVEQAAGASGPPRDAQP